MKTIYFIRHAKTKNLQRGESDFERSLKQKAYKQISIIGSYLKLRKIQPDLILSSCSLRAQDTSLKLAEKLEYEGKIEYFKELYVAPNEEVIEILKAQDDAQKTLFVVGHNPFLSELVNILSSEHIAKIPTMGVVCVHFEQEKWSEIEKTKGRVEFFIFPKQFQYYLPQEFRTASVIIP